MQSPEFLFFFAYSAFIVVIFQGQNLYKINVILTRSRHIVAIVTSFIYALVGLSLVAFFIHSNWILDSRLAVSYFAIIGFLLITGYRVFLFRPLFIYLNKNQVLRKNVLIVGSNLEARNLAVQLAVDNAYGLKLIGFVDDRAAVGSKIFEHYTILGKVEDVVELVGKLKIHEIIVTLSDISYNHLLKIVDICAKTSAQVRVTSTLFDIVHRKVPAESYFNIPVVRLGNLDHTQGMLIFKRIFDTITVSLILVVLAIPILIVAGLIKLTSRGSVFYSQNRVGKDGKQFKFYKFRSMIVGSEEDTHHAEHAREFVKGTLPHNGSTKVVNESLITPLGRLLRKTSLDEIPQFLNVLKGDMSLVGPRPCLPYEYEVYEEWHKRRMSVLPGCTGLWQVSSRSEVGFDDMVLLDLYYIDNMSPLFDLQLILKTIPVMVLGRGAK